MIHASEMMHSCALRWRKTECIKMCAEGLSRFLCFPTLASSCSLRWSFVTNLFFRAANAGYSRDRARAMLTTLLRQWRPRSNTLEHSLTYHRRWSFLLILLLHHAQGVHGLTLPRESVEAYLSGAPGVRGTRIGMRRERPRRAATVLFVGSNAAASRFRRGPSTNLQRGCVGRRGRTGGPRAPPGCYARPRRALACSGRLGAPRRGGMRSRWAPINERNPTLVAASRTRSALRSRDGQRDL